LKEKNAVVITERKGTVHDCGGEISSGSPLKHYPLPV